MQPFTFLGHYNVYQRFISTFARISAPLTNKLRNDDQHTFSDMTEAEMTSFRRLKDDLVKPHVLELPRSDLTYVLDADS